MHAKDEAGAAFMADASARAVGKRLGVCASTSGPGATNLLTGVAGAFADSVPMLVITGQAETAEIGRGGIQEGSGIGRSPHVGGMYRHATKRSWQVTAGPDIGEELHKLVELAITGRRGPVHLDVPYDLWRAPVQGPWPIAEPVSETRAPALPPDGATAALRAVLFGLREAKAPVLFLGQGMRNIPGTVLRALADRGIAVTTTLGAKGVLPESHGCSLGMAGCYGQEVSARYLIEQADFVVLVGTSLQYLSTIGWHARFDSKRVIHVELDPTELSKSFPAATKLVADGRKLLTDLVPAVQENGLCWERTRHEIQKLKDQYGYYPAAYNRTADPEPAPITPSTLFTSVHAANPNATVVIDSGENAYWAMLSYQSEAPKFFANCFWGCMGYALPAALAVALETSKRTLAFVGDGGLLMTGMELHTAVQYRTPLTLFVLNNQCYGTQYHWQRDHASSSRGYATTIDGFDVQLFARSMGARYVKLGAAEDLSAFLRRHPEDVGTWVAEVPIDKQAKPRQVSYSQLQK